MQDSEFFFLTNENKTLSGVDELKCPAEVYVPTGVTKIDRRAFASCPAKKIFLPDSVTQIGYEAFYGCDALEYVRFPKKIKSVEPAIFRECFSLQKVEFGDEISFSESMFECCYSLEEAPFRIGITELPRNVFSECTSIESLVIPEGVAVIKTGAAAYCQNLSTLVLPSSMRIIEDDAFRNCVNLAHIRFSAENPVFFIDEDSGALFERHDDGTLSLIKVPVKTTQIRIPKNVTHSHSEAFQGCDSIEKVFIDCAMVDHPLFVALKTEIVDAEFINETEAENKTPPEPEIEKSEAEETPDSEESADAETPPEMDAPKKKPRKPREKKQKPAVIDETLSDEPSEPQIKIDMPTLETAGAEAQNKAEEIAGADETENAIEAEHIIKAEQEHSQDDSAQGEDEIADEPSEQAAADEYEIAFEPEIDVIPDAEEIASADETENAIEAEVVIEAEQERPQDYSAQGEDEIADEPNEQSAADDYEIAFEPQIEEPAETEEIAGAAEAENAIETEVVIETEQAHSQDDSAQGEDEIADEPSEQAEADDYEIAFEPEIDVIPDAEEISDADETENAIEAEAVIEVEQEHSQDDSAQYEDEIAEEPSEQAEADDYEIAFEPQIEEPAETEEIAGADETENAIEAEQEHSQNNSAQGEDEIAAILEQNIATSEITEENELRGITITIEELDEAMMRGIQEEEESDYKIPEGIFPANDAEEAPEDLPPPEPRFVNGMISVSGAFEVIDERTLYPDRAEEDLCALAPNEMEDITTLVVVTESLNDDGKISESAKEFCVALSKKYDLKRVYLFGALGLDNEEFLYGFEKFALYRNVVFVPDAAEFDALSSEVKAFAEIAELDKSKFHNLKNLDLPELELPFKIFACENSQSQIEENSAEEISDEKIASEENVLEETEHEEIAAEEIPVPQKEAIPDSTQENQTQKKNTATGKGLLARAQEKESVSGKGLLARAQSALKNGSAD